jgi:hypothetical protein
MHIQDENIFNICAGFSYCLLIIYIGSNTGIGAGATDGKITCRESNFLLSLNLSESVNIDYVKF